MQASLKVVAYNIMIPVLPPIRVYGQFERAKRVAEVISQCGDDVDVVALMEVIPISIDKEVIKGMNELGFCHYTEHIKDMMAERGGIMIFSKFPIIDSNHTFYGNICASSDCLSSKGVVYAKIEKESLRFNVFATHMQAWPDLKFQKIRAKQIEHVRRFMKQVNCPQREPVLFCGDLNVDYYLDRAQFNYLLSRLKMVMPLFSKDSHPFTVDPLINQLVGNDEPNSYASEDYPDGCVNEYMETRTCVCCKPLWIDYILFSHENLQPITSSIRAIPAKVDPFEMSFSVQETIMSQDVSDHFPVMSEMTFEFEASLDPVEKQKNIDTNPNNTQNTAFISLIVILGLIVLSVFVLWFWYYWKRRRQTFTEENGGRFLE